jgi:uroporphyrinogen-III decarboxylase
MVEAAIRGCGDAGADAVMFWEDMGTQTGPLFSPAMFREFFKPDYTHLADVAHQHGLKVLMHSCGNNAALLDDLLDIGIDVFQFDQPALYDMPALADKLCRRRRCLWSPVDIQKVLPTGDRAFIERETLRLCRTFEGGLILKDYPDLASLGIHPEWDGWAYDVIVKFCGLGRRITGEARDKHGTRTGEMT